LTHTLDVSQAGLILVDPTYERSARQAASQGDTRPRVDVVKPGAESFTSAGSPLPADSVRAEPAQDSELETATLLFTSGTTGPSKACALSHRYLVRQGQLHAKYMGLGEDDVLYSPFPLFHIDAATLTVSAALSVRATAALGRRFSASGFWDEARAVRATVFNFMGATLTILWKRQATPRDRDHQVRLAWGVPIPEWQSEFEERFAIPLRQVYGLTDGGIPVYDPLDREQQRPGYAGRVIDEYEVRIDQSRRRPGDPDGVGEILIRGREPGLVMNGYYRDPTTTAATVADGWVRTGDLGSLDDDGFLKFHGRLSDSIRRRGENISAFEVEELVGSHPDVVEASAVGVPSEMTEEDVLVCVVRRPGTSLTAQSLFAYCLAKGAKHMAPRFIRFVPQLPKTPTQKVQKFALRADGVTLDTWDAESVRLGTPGPRRSSER
jgi:crotonobetaine/carnitine-CoA ligase